MSFGSSGFPNYGSTSSHSTSGARPRTMSDLSHYNQLCDNISCNIFSINNNVAALESLSKDIGTKFDSTSLRDKIHQYRQSTNELVQSTTRFVTELQRLVQIGVGKEQRFQAKRLDNEYRETLKRFDIFQKILVPKMKQAVLSADKTSGFENNYNDGHSEELLIDIEKKQQTEQLQAELEFEHGLLIERDQRILQIESDIVDINQAFKDLGAIVHEQGDMLGTIEENITTTAHQVHDGTEQLVKASNYQKKYRNKLCWLIIILLFIGGTITIIVTVETR